MKATEVGAARREASEGDGGDSGDPAERRLGGEASRGGRWAVVAVVGS
jgi:hypothetical protein